MYLPKVYEKFIEKTAAIGLLRDGDRIGAKLENDPNSPRFIVSVAGGDYKYMADADNEI
jgi:hypothetical protein